MTTISPSPSLHHSHDLPLSQTLSSTSLSQHHSNTPLQIDSSKYDCVAIADAIYPPQLPKNKSTTALNRYDYYLMLMISVLLSRVILAIFATNLNSTLNSSIQLTLYAIIWASCYYFRRLYAPYFAITNSSNQRQQQQQQSHLSTTQPSISSTQSQPQTQLTPSFIINTDRKLTVFIFFIFNFLLFALLVGMIEDFHGFHGSPDKHLPSSIYHPRHPLHTTIPGHLNPKPIHNIINPHKTLHTFLQLYPLQKHIHKHQSPLHLTTHEEYIKDVEEEESSHDENINPNDLLPSNIINPSTPTTSTTTTDDTKSAIQDQDKDMNKITPQQIIRHSTIFSKSNIFTILTLLLSIFFHGLLLILTYPFAPHLLSSSPLITYFSIKLPTSSLQRWYCGISPTISSNNIHQLTTNRGTNVQLQQQTDSFLSLTSTSSSQQRMPPLAKVFRKWSYSWFYYQLYPYQLATLTPIQRMNYFISNLFAQIGITFTPQSLFDITILSTSYYICLFIFVKDVTAAIGLCESIILQPLFLYSRSKTPKPSQDNITFLQLIQFHQIIYPMIFTMLWLFKIIIAIIALYWICSITISSFFTLVRGSSRSTTSSIGSTAASTSIPSEMQQICFVLQELENIYKTQFLQPPTSSNSLQLPYNSQQLQQHHEKFTTLLYERLHVWKLSHNINIITLCIFYDTIMKPSQHNPQQLQQLPPWCIEVFRYLIHDNGLIGSGYRNNNINGGKLNFSMLVPMPQSIINPSDNNNRNINKVSTSELLGHDLPITRSQDDPLF